MAGIFLDASVIAEANEEKFVRFNVQQAKIRFEFPEGFTQLRLIEECRALNALDLDDPDNFDLMYDITMQMLVGKPVFIYYIEDITEDEKFELSRFVVTDRYMNLRSVDAIDEYPVLVNWLVEFIASFLSKKYPRSLNDIQAKMSEKKEHLKSLKK